MLQHLYVTEKPIPAPETLYVKTVSMQTTGSPLPLPLFVMAVLMVLSGFKLRRGDDGKNIIHLFLFLFLDFRHIKKK